MSKALRRIIREATSSRPKATHRRRKTGALVEAAHCERSDAISTRWGSSARDCHRALIEEVGFAVDSPLEGAGFEPSVPRKGDGFETAFRAAGKAAEWSTL